MKIVIDAMGGDNAPREIVKGAVQAKEYGHEIILTGKLDDIMSVSAEEKIDLSGIEIINTDIVMTYDDDSKAVLKAKKDSSMGIGFTMMAEGKADAFVSAGPTGALYLGGTFIVKRIRGVSRPALASVIPSATGSFLLIDCGANAECRPDALLQFGIMGSLYMQRVMDVDCPRVGLANNGAEPSKGTPLQQEAYALLESDKSINFIGNVEGRDIPLGACDVAVTDGFTGNLILKTIEGLASAMFQKLKIVFYKNLATKLASAVLKPGLVRFKDSMSASKYGGAPIIGLTKPVIKAHGNSDAEAIKNAVRQAITWHESGVTEEIEKYFAPKEQTI